MAIKINIKELTDVSAPSNDHYSVTAILQLVEDEVVLEEKPITVAGYEYEAETLRKAVRTKLRDAGKEWRERFVKARRMADKLEGLAGEP